MRPQRSSAKQVDYASIDRTPPAIRHLSQDALSDFFPSEPKHISSPFISTKSKRKATKNITPEVVNKRKRQIQDSPAKPDSPVQKKLKQYSKGKKKDDGQDKENKEVNPNKLAQKEKDEKVEVKEKKEAKGKKQKKIEIVEVVDIAEESYEVPTVPQDPPSAPTPINKRSKPSLIPAKEKSSKTSKPLPAKSSSSSSSSSSASTALVLSPNPYISLQQQKRVPEDPIIAMTNIIADEIKEASVKACSLESEMVLARNSKQFMKTQDHRYEKLRVKYDELKQSIKEQPASEKAISEEHKALLAKMKEAMKDLEQDRTVARKKIKEQTKELEHNKALLEEDKKVVETEKRRIEEEGKEIQIEKRRIERKELEKERQDLDRERWVAREEKKEIEARKVKAEEEAQELARRRKQIEEERAHLEREKRKHAEELAKDQQQYAAWKRQLEGEERKMEEQKWRWDEERKNITKKQEDIVSSLKWNLECEKQSAAKSKQANAELADKLTSATHQWAEYQEQMDREIKAMVQLVDTSEKKEEDTLKFLSMITGLIVNKLAPNRFLCVCANQNYKSRVKFEVTIREDDVEYTPLEVVGGHMPECVKEGIFFQREDWPIFLCKIIASVFRS